MRVVAAFFASALLERWPCWQRIASHSCMSVLQRLQQLRLIGKTRHSFMTDPWESMDIVSREDGCHSGSDLANCPEHGVMFAEQGGTHAVDRSTVTPPTRSGGPAANTGIERRASRAHRE